jgi:hypothetical protein
LRAAKKFANSTEATEITEIRSPLFSVISGASVVSFLLGCGCAALYHYLFLYGTDTKANIQITRELAERRKEYAS